MMIPEYTTFKQWALSLIVDFPQENIPLAEDEKDWKSWGESLLQTTSFSGKGAPTPQGYPNWRSWAKDIYLVLSG